LALSKEELASLMDNTPEEAEETPKPEPVAEVAQEEDDEEFEAPVQLTPDNVKSIGGLPIQRVGDMPHRYIKFLIFADPGAGKTWLTGSASVVEEMSPVLLLDIDGGDLTLFRTFPDVEVVRVKDWKSMQSLYKDLRKGDFEYKTFGVDSLTELQKFNMDQLMFEAWKADHDKDRDKPGWDEFNKNGNQTRRVVRLFRDLPVNVIFTCHVMYKQNKEGQIIGRMPDLTGKLSRQVPGFIDTVGYLYPKVIDGEVVRLMQTFSDGKTIAKDRSGRLPKIVRNPDMQMIYNAYFGK